jgi:hypothetical protein
MAAKVVVEGSSAVTASQLKDLFRQIDDRSITGQHIQAFLEHRDPFAPFAPFAPSAFERNEHGHAIIAISGLDCTGAEEVSRLEAAGYRVSDYAKSCFRSSKGDGYDKNHRLQAGRAYKIAIVPGKEIERDAERTTANLQKLGEKYGYQKPLAGIVPRIREAVSDEMMKDLDVWYIAALHDPIKDSDGDPSVLNAFRDDGGRWVLARWDRPGVNWDSDGSFAFLLPASA